MMHQGNNMAPSLDLFIPNKHSLPNDFIFTLRMQFLCRFFCFNHLPNRSSPLKCSPQQSPLSSPQPLSTTAAYECPALSTSRVPDKPSPPLHWPGWSSIVSPKRFTAVNNFSLSTYKHQLSITYNIEFRKPDNCQTSFVHLWHDFLSIVLIAQIIPRFLTA